MAAVNYPVSSSAISAISYDADKELCMVTFKDGRTYALQDFPKDELLAWVSSGSVGSYWNTNLKGEY